MTQSTFINLLKQFTRFITQLSEDDLDALAAGKKRLSIELLDEKRLSNSRNATISLEFLENALAEIASRDEAEQVLYNLKKSQLVELARRLDLPVQRSEDTSRLKEKIIESTIGFKLRSQAIQQSDDA